MFCRFSCVNSIREPACLYLFVWKTYCMYQVCINPKCIHISTYIFNISVFFCIVCMYVCMCLYEHVSIKRLQDIQTYTVIYRQYIRKHTIQSIQSKHTIHADTYIYTQYTHIHAILANACNTCTYMHMYVCTCMCLYLHVLLVLCRYMHLYVRTVAGGRP